MKILKNYGLSIVLGILFLASWAAQGYYQWQEFVGNEELHREMPQFSDFVPEFLAATFENWQSEFLQLFSFVVLATYLIHKDSPQSRDGDDRRDKQLQRIEKLLKQKVKKR